jgi:hypothetical protein
VEFQQSAFERTKPGVKRVAGKKIRVKFRASNGLGIWSRETASQAVEIDTSEPDVQTVNRDWADEQKKEFKN